MDSRDANWLPLRQRVLKTAEEGAGELYNSVKFNEDCTLTLIPNLVKSREFRANYEKVVGGNAYKNGIPAKTRSIVNSESSSGTPFLSSYRYLIHTASRKTEGFPMSPLRDMPF